MVQMHLHLWNNFNWCFLLGIVQNMYVCFPPSVMSSAYLTTLLLWAAFINKELFWQSRLGDVSWHFSIFLSSEALIATDNETLKWRHYRELIDLISGAFGHNAFSDIWCGCLWKERYNSVTEKDHFFSKSSMLQWCLLEIYTFDRS